MNFKEMSEFIQFRRKSLRVSQPELARLCGLSVHTISNVESGKGNPTLDVLLKITTVLGLDVRVDVPKP